MAIGKKRVACLMGAAGLVGGSRRQGITTAKRDPAYRPPNDMVRRNFFVENPNELWVADIIFVPPLAGFLFLAVVMDAWSRRTVGWAFSADLKKRVVLDALDRHRLRSHSEARMAVFCFIEGFYNPSRRHSALGYLSPIEYERLHHELT